MKETVTYLYKLQMSYLERIVDNIPDELLYAQQLEGYNSAGWLLGHLCVEVEDIFAFLTIPFDSLDGIWNQNFRNTTGRIASLKHLPTKHDLMVVLKLRYSLLLSEYLKLPDSTLNAQCPSKMLAQVLPSVDAWIVHHLTTHLAAHCGNIVVWKKMVALEVNGF